MKTTPVTKDDLTRSVLAVPPLARSADFSPDTVQNRAIVRHLEAGGVTTLLYGGNANFYNIGSGDYASLLDMLEGVAAPDTWLIPSIGPSFGLAMDQARWLRGRDFPTAMVLPMNGQATPAGVETGLARIAEAFGRPVILYLRAENYLEPAALARLVQAGMVTAVKYAVERPDPLPDAYLAALCEAAGSDTMVSGMGELPALAHLRDAGLTAFTSGSVCVAPNLSMATLAACRGGDFTKAARLRALFLPLEELRNALNPIRVLHEAVRLAGIAETGPLLPMLSNIETAHHQAIGAAARELLAADRALALAA
ncbi:dihydrodipicolinate synthase family protein [Acidiphilium iwatense]|uniref:Dihydrodipicolinate synthase family protein n=1 Tax=Acidiphilium iwatense TaxID=768198 RepID=A0ABS9DTH6_9PROT|nr:dihydrodipicolinate synthase family protein [Acidiphilium iwatense]MCF3946041.1 dihydrodipicolinate synthase family protein [Acidiphilium iwatense]